MYLDQYWMDLFYLHLFFTFYINFIVTCNMHVHIVHCNYGQWLIKCLTQAADHLTIPILRAKLEINSQVPFFELVTSFQFWTNDWLRHSHYYCVCAVSVPVQEPVPAVCVVGTCAVRCPVCDEITVHCSTVLYSAVQCSTGERPVVASSVPRP